MEIKVGKSYKVNHSRKGKFQLKITSLDDTWATGIIEKGRATAICEHNEVEEGESITIRKSFVSFTEIK